MNRSSFSSVLFAAAFSTMMWINADSSLGQSSRFSNAAVFAGNQFENEFGQLQLIGDFLENDSSNNGFPVSVVNHFSDWTGYDSSGQQQTMTLSGSSYAYADYGRIQTYTSGRLENTFYSEENNDPYYDHETNSINPDGIPDLFDIYGYAGFNEVLQYGGSAVNYNSKYIFNLHGDISGGEAFVYIRMKHADNFEETWFFSGTGSYNVPIISNAYIHGGFPQTFQLSMFTSFQPNLEYLGEGLTVTGDAYFDRTLDLVGIDLRDENGVLLPPGSVTGESGTTYNIVSAIPEPSSAMLLWLGLIGMGLRTRRRSM